MGCGTSVRYSLTARGSTRINFVKLPGCHTFVTQPSHVYKPPLSDNEKALTGFYIHWHMCDLMLIELISLHAMIHFHSHGQ